MKTPAFVRYLSAAGVMSLAAFVSVPKLVAHCDGLDGPVVSAARRALTESNVDLVLIWVTEEDEAEIKRVFEHTVAVRKLGREAQELADRYFFETLVRVHRAGEGEPFTGLKPKERDLGPAIAAADKALETDDVNALWALLSNKIEQGMRERFTEVVQRSKFAAGDVAAGRAYVRAYVSYIHYVDGIHRAADGTVGGHPGEATGARADHSGHHGQP